MKIGSKFRIDWAKVLDSGRRIRGLSGEQLDGLRDRHEHATLTALSVSDSRVCFKYPDTPKGMVYTVSLGLTKLSGIVKLMKPKRKQ